MIENAGGHLEILPNGRLHGQHVPRELHADAKEHKHALIALLQERSKPAAAPGFVYHERSANQWNRRITQSLRSSFGVAVEDAEIEDGDESDSEESPKSAKVSSTTTTPCVCGHARKDHHTAPEAHVADGEFAYYCL